MRPRVRIELVAFAGAMIVLALRPVDAQVAFERAGFRLTSIGERITVSGRVVDASRRPVATGSIRWRVADPSIASVTPQGVLVSRRVGNTRLWAVAGTDSASALILVDQWAARFDFLPPSLRLEAKAEKKPLRIIVRDAGGYPISGQNRKPCRSLNERVATLAPNGDVTAVANGVTYVRCADRGIADSARIEVRQRPVQATIADKPSFAARVLGDTFRLRLNATDASGDAIVAIQSTWASLNPTIVSIDPVTGLARGVGMGTARVVAQAGDATDTVSVGIAQAAGLPVPANADTAVTASTRSLMPTLRFEPTYPFVGDTAPIRYSVRDPNGIEIPNANVTLESSDTSIFELLPRGRALLKKEGPAYVRGRFGETVDSGQVVVRARTPVTVLDRDSAAAARPFVRPTFDTTALNKAYKERRDAINDTIFRSSRLQGSRAPWFTFSTLLAFGQSAHSFSDSTGTERRSGFVYGGTAALRFVRNWQLAAELRTGGLASSGSTGTELGVTEATGSVAFARENFVAGGGYTLRAMREGPASSPLATQRWTIPRAFVSVRPAFIGGAVRTVMGLNAAISAKYTGYTDAAGNQIDPSPLSFGGEAGLEYRWRSLRVGTLYNVESFAFEKIGNSERRDQFSTLRITAGWQYAR